MAETTTRSRSTLVTVSLALFALLIGVPAGVYAHYAYGESERGTSEACLAALDDADELLMVTSVLMGETVPLATESAYFHDVAGMEEAIVQLENANAIIEESQYGVNAAECRAEQ